MKASKHRRGGRLRVLVIAGAVLTLVCAGVVAVVQLRDSSAASGGERVAYFAGWNIENREFTVADIHRNGAAASLTTLLWAFGDVNSEGLCHVLDTQAWRLYQERYAAEDSVSGEADSYDQPLAGGLNQLRQLREEYPGLRTGLSLGGWNLSTYFSNAAATEESREAFAESCIDLWLRGDMPESDSEPQGGPGVAEGVFDGIDIDWEWPAGDGHPDNVTRPEDRRNFTLLIEELRNALDDYSAETGRQVFLSASVPNTEDLMRGGMEPEVFQHFDFIMVQGYDMTGPWSDVTSPHAQLYAPDEAPDGTARNSADAAVQRYIDYGVPRERIVLGYPAYGRGWQGVPAENDGRFQTADAAAEGTYGEGTMSYGEIEELDSEAFVDTDSVAAWRYDGDAWWGYDNPEVVRLKGEYAREQRLGGLMQWNLDQDPDGELVRAMDEGLRG